MNPFEARIPLLKAEAQDDGSLRVAGVVSDESLDFARERMPQGVLAEKSYDLLAKWGTINWRDHPRTSIGEVEFIGPITPEQALAKYNQVIEGTGTEVVAKLHPIVDAAIAPNDLKEAHHAVRAGARLGWSVEGQYRKRRTAEGFVATSAIANRICLTDQPVNMNTVARPLYKSLGAIEGDIDENDAADGLSQAAEALPVPPVPLVVYAPVGEFAFIDTAPLAKTFTADDIPDEVVEELLKAGLAAGPSTLDAAAKVGGDALVGEGLLPKKRRTTKHKRAHYGGKEGFAAVEAEAKHEGARDPAAVAAVAGRRALGQAEMTRRSVAGRMKKSFGEMLRDAVTGRWRRHMSRRTRGGRRAGK